MKVLKFGGTSVDSVEGLTNVKNIAESSDDNIIIVVSAFGGITDSLISTAQKAASRNISYKESYASITARHFDIIDRMITNSCRLKRVYEVINSLFEELTNLFNGLYLIGDLSDKTLDTIAGYGERLSSLIISNIIEGAVWYDSRDFIKTEKKHSQHLVVNEVTDKLIKETFRYLPKIAIVPGFIAQDNKTGDITNLGRGGSDYTAALIAASLHATILEIWTNVDGFMTADPKVISSAYTIPHLSYVEAMELCNFGAKVIYPPTIYPVCQKNIPILIKNTFRPEASGTLITNESIGNNKLIQGISSIADTALITVSGLGMVGVIGVNHRIFKVLAEAGISVFMVSQASSENNTSIGVRSIDAEKACQVLNEEFEREISAGVIYKVNAEYGLSTVAIVGENMKRTPGIAGKLFGTIGRNGINAKAFAQGASETNISFVINNCELKKALNVIHDSFFLSEYKVLNVFICGIGTVGKSLIEQIRTQQSKLISENGLKLNIVGIANSKKLLLDREGLPLDNYIENINNNGIQSSPDILKNKIIEMNIFNSVFVDCTASQEISGIYKDLLSHNISVVTANKIAASGKYEDYAELKSIARHRDVKFLFETNVGAGLPIINTINDLINSGDRILKIEAVLSGTLNYIFNTISKNMTFSQTVNKAVKEGYAEPDPRIDLSGRDVLRKLVILAREAGYRLEQSDIEQNMFIPAEILEGSIDKFNSHISDLDASFEEQRKAIEAENKKWRFIARLDNGKGSIGLETVEAGSPFFNLEGSNNIVLITTERYREYPMLIQGYGAGASVTAQHQFDTSALNFYKLILVQVICMPQSI